VLSARRRFCNTVAHVLLSWGAFAWLVYLTNICHLRILATMWEMCTCTDIGHLYCTGKLSVNVTQVKSNHQCCTNATVIAFWWLVWKAMCFAVSAITKYEYVPDKILEEDYMLLSWVLVQCTVSGRFYKYTHHGKMALVNTLGCLFNGAGCIASYSRTVVNKRLWRSRICLRDYGKLQKPILYLNYTYPEHFFSGCFFRDSISFIYQFWWDILTVTLHWI
jgi:hypothetical protein